jgi:hypothetical protein
LHRPKIVFWPKKLNYHSGWYLASLPSRVNEDMGRDLSEKLLIRPMKYCWEKKEKKEKSWVEGRSRRKGRII